MYRQFGKPSGPLLKQKTSFFEQNDLHILKQNEISEVYKRQPLRQQCKTCGHKLLSEPDFEKLGVGYVYCRNCTHLNGCHEDTADYCAEVYTGSGARNYGANYSSKNLADFKYRQSSIYGPKAEFLYSALLADGIDPSNLTYMDFGCGAGYFVGALQDIGVENVFGTEVSASQIDLGNRVLRSSPLRQHNLDETESILRQTKASVVSLIGVLEHLSDPRGAVKAIAANKATQYFYFSVPMDSPSIFIEMTNEQLFHRHLQGGHTHLYTESSLQYLASENGFSITAEWWFGADIVDWYRSMWVSLQQHQNKFMRNKLTAELVPVIDALQLQLDRAKKSSEVHMLWKKN